jgi:linoleoyl-CoA desaturase
MSAVTFNNQKAVFFRTIQARVEQYFQDKNLKKTGNARLYLKSGILIGAGLAMYIILLTVSMHPVLALSLCVLFGITQSCIGFNVMHDANHGSYSSIKWINTMMGLSANTMGVNAWFWKQKHNIIHHTFTNVDGVDDDIIKAPFLRLCPSQKQQWIHRFQYIYCIPMYGITSLMWIFYSDFEKYFQRRIQDIPMKEMVVKEHIIFWASKILYGFFFMAVPIYMVGFMPFLVGFLVVHFAMGLSLALVFQLAHVVEATHFEDANDNPNLKIDDEWAVHQVRTTADFATNNKIVSWFTGGLNFQVEHHLFPNISHIHYPVIHKIVKDVCQNHSVKFNNYPHMRSALASHLRFLKQLGKSA